MLNYYERDQVLILNSDWVKKNEPEALKHICRFLNVDETFAFFTPGTFPTSSVKHRWLQCGLRKIYGSRFDAKEKTLKPVVMLFLCLTTFWPLT